MALEPTGVQKPKPDIGLEARQELRVLLSERPLTRGALDLVEENSRVAADWELRVAETPRTEDNVPLNERFLEAHAIFVRHLEDISYRMGRLENAAEQLAAAKVVEWQTADGPTEHKMFEQANQIIEDSRKKLNGAKEATLRKLEGLMKTAFVQDAIHSNANKELEAFDKGNRQEGQQ